MIGIYAFNGRTAFFVLSTSQTIKVRIEILALIGYEKSLHKFLLYSFLEDEYES